MMCKVWCAKLSLSPINSHTRSLALAVKSDIPNSCPEPWFLLCPPCVPIVSKGIIQSLATVANRHMHRRVIPTKDTRVDAFLLVDRVDVLCIVHMPCYLDVNVAPTTPAPAETSTH